MEPNRPTVFVVDDDPMIRQALILLLGCEQLVAKGYASAECFLTAYQPQWPGCLLLDMDLPGLNGLNLQAILAERKIHIPIVFLTGRADVSKTAQAFRGGAIDLLEKPATDEALLTSIHKALANDAKSRETEALESLAGLHFQRLTPRQREVMKLMVTGKSNKEVARTLQISPRTAEGHRQRIMEKMETLSLPELVGKAHACGLLPRLSPTT